MACYIGKLLRVDLSNRRISDEPLNEDSCRKFLGGAGVATKYLYDEVKAGIDPLGPDNELIFMTGPLTGTISPSSGRYSVVAKSPLTGIWGQSNSGGSWGVDLKKSGYDGIIIKGIASEPVFLQINDGEAQIVSASEIWGKSVPETTQVLRTRNGDKIGVACIGVAGENKVLFANIMNDTYRAAGRCGMGAVMGSKHLKAIAVGGTHQIKAADQYRFTQASKKAYDMLDQAMIKIGFETFGTNMASDLTNVRGGFPTRNWQTGVCPHIEEIGATALSEKVLTDKWGCFACSIKCGRRSKIGTGPFAGRVGEGPEFETVGTFGGMCAIDSLEAITMIHYICNELGLDTISAGNTIGFAMECFEKGILTTSDTDGVKLNFGNFNAAIEMLQRIANRKGIGDLLGQGVRRMSEKLGKGSGDFAMHVKGLELPAYDSRAVKATGLAYATANRGGDHMTAYVQGPSFLDYPFLVVDESRILDPLVVEPREARIVVDLENALTIFDCAGSCKFMGMGIAHREMADVISAAVGWEFGLNEFKLTGERVYNLARAFSNRQGLSTKEDTLPKRLLVEPLPEGPAQGCINELKPLLDAYYEYRGWDKTSGKPSREKLIQLGLDEVAKDLWASEGKR